jgi:hypothetical protein
MVSYPQHAIFSNDTYSSTPTHFQPRPSRLPARIRRKITSRATYGLHLRPPSTNLSMENGPGNDFGKLEVLVGWSLSLRSIAEDVTNLLNEDPDVYPNFSSLPRAMPSQPSSITPPVRTSISQVETRRKTRKTYTRKRRIVGRHPGYIAVSRFEIKRSIFQFRVKVPTDAVSVRARRDMGGKESMFSLSL